MHLLVLAPPSLCRLCFGRVWTLRGAYVARRAKPALFEGVLGGADFFVFFYEELAYVCAYRVRMSSLRMLYEAE
jgi:hypothetical protein